MKFAKLAAATLLAGATLMGTSVTASAANGLTAQEQEAIDRMNLYLDTYLDNYTCADMQGGEFERITKSELRNKYHVEFAAQMGQAAAKMSPAMFKAFNAAMENGINKIVEKGIECGVVKDDKPAGLGNANGSGGSSFSS